MQAVAEHKGHVAVHVAVQAADHGPETVAIMYLQDGVFAGDKAPIRGLRVHDQRPLVVGCAAFQARRIVVCDHAPPGVLLRPEDRGALHRPGGVGVPLGQAVILRHIQHRRRALGHLDLHPKGHRGGLAHAKEGASRIAQRPKAGVGSGLGRGGEIQRDIHRSARRDHARQRHLVWSAHLRAAGEDQGIVGRPLAGAAVAHPPDLGEGLARPEEGVIGHAEIHDEIGGVAAPWRGRDQQRGWRRRQGGGGDRRWARRGGGEGRAGGREGDRGGRAGQLGELRHGGRAGLQGVLQNRILGGLCLPGADIQSGRGCFGLA